MKILVTGGAGFIGSHLAEALCTLYHDVVVLDNLSGGRLENVPSEARFVNCDICNYDKLKELFFVERFDYIFHTAAYAAESLSHHMRGFNYNTNVMGSVNLINLSVLFELKCFVFISSIAVYGDIDVELTEDVDCQPIDPYGISKLTIEHDLRAAQRHFGLNYLIFRLHNVYGERQNMNDIYRNVVAIFFKKVLNGEPITIFGDGSQTRYFTYVRDVVSVITQSANPDGVLNQTIILGNDTAISINSLANIIESFSVNPPHNIFLRTRNEVHGLRISHLKAKRLYPNFAVTPLGAGLQKMYDWVLDSRYVFKSSVKQPIEIRKQLPDGW